MIGISFYIFIYIYSNKNKYDLLAYGVDSKNYMLAKTIIEEFREVIAAFEKNSKNF